MVARKTTTDPFADDTAVSTPEVETAEAKNSTTAASATLKAGSSYNAPWVVVRGADVAELNDQLRDPAMRDLLEITAKSALYLDGLMPAPEVPEKAPANNPTPPQQKSDTGETRHCKHGEMQFRSGSKNGRAWSAFFCPTPKGTADQCAAEFMR